MAGVKELEKVIDGIRVILDAAERAGPDAWTFDGRTLSITSEPLVAKILAVIDSLNKIKIREEGDDLNAFKMAKLYRRGSDIPRRIIALITKEK